MRALCSFRRFAAAAAFAAALVATPSAAAVKLGLGADFALDPGYGGGLFSLTLAVNAPIAHNIAVGGRFGGMLTTNYTVGAPLDFELLVSAAGGRVYLGGLIGPWLVFNNANSFPVRFHGAFEFGLNMGGLSFGMEVGYLQGNAIFGFRMGFRI
jgi:hypothetical protein